jgi:hypothetical protein
MKKLVLGVILGLQLAGCQSYEGAYSRPMLARMNYGALATGAIARANLPKDFLCVLPGGTLIGGNRVTVLAGEYVVHARDARGVFWRHTNRGIIRSGNLGRVEEGGIYCPYDRTERCLLWIVPKDNGPLFLGAVTIYPAKAEPDRYAIYVGDVPTELSQEMRPYLDSKDEPDQPPLRMPVSGTPAADAPVAPPPGIAGR